MCLKISQPCNSMPMDNVIVGCLKLEGKGGGRVGSRYFSLIWLVGSYAKIRVLTRSLPLSCQFLRGASTWATMAHLTYTLKKRIKGCFREKQTDNRLSVGPMTHIQG